jgi:hypothetical protein
LSVSLSIAIGALILTSCNTVAFIIV